LEHSKFLLFSIFQRIITLVIVFAALTSSTQDVEFSCTFYLSQYEEYICILEEIELTDPNTRVTFIGEHLDNRTNEDVTNVEISFSNTPFIIPEIFTTFTNMKDFRVFFSMLENISSIPDTVQLDRMLMTGNRIPRIENNTFITQPSIQRLDFVISSIENVEENAFIGLENCTSLTLMLNSISELHSRTFHPLINARAIDLRGNRLEIIQDELFSQNSKLEILLLENNRINAISPRFTAAFIGSLEFAFFSNNPCIDRDFDLTDDFGIIFMHANLKRCYDNFTGANEGDSQTVQLQIRGTLTINDEFGNNILRN
jgi:hypothetical protein